MIDKYLSNIIKLPSLQYFNCVLLRNTKQLSVFKTNILAILIRFFVSHAQFSAPLNETIGKIEKRREQIEFACQDHPRKCVNRQIKRKKHIVVKPIYTLLASLNMKKFYFLAIKLRTTSKYETFSLNSLDHCSRDNDETLR